MKVSSTKVPRKLVPPFAVVVGFVMVFVSRVVNSRLAFGMWSSPWEAIMHGAMMASLATFWVWPPRVPERTRDASRPMLRLATSLALVYACLAPMMLSATSTALSWQTFIWFAYVPVFNFLLTFPLARLFARLRLDPTLPSSTALGPCALFFGTQAHFEDGLMHAAMTGSLITFWLWPPRQAEEGSEPGNTALRMGALLALTFGGFAPLVLVKTYVGLTLLGFLLYSYVIVYNFLLIWPLARVFARLRLDASIPGSAALGPCVMFFFFALMVPASVHSFRPDSPTYLRWILLIVPPFTWLVLALFLRDQCARTGARWWRELLTLCWQNARLPVLFCLGEFALAASISYTIR